MSSRNDYRETVEACGDEPREPLVDRVLELDLLRQHIARVIETGKGHVVLILGESGVGKSRIAAEAGAEASTRGMTMIPVRCLGRGAEPLLPLKEALASYLGRTPGQIRRTLARAAPRLLDAVPFIGSFLGAVGEKITEGAEVSRDLKGVYEELSRVLIKAIAGRSGLFLLVDDLHSADPDTLYFLNYLFRKLDQMPVLAVATIKEEQLNDYPQLGDLVAEWTASGYAALTVVPLERAHVGEYVRQRAAMGQDPDEATVDRLFQLTGGNPFFLREALNLITQAARDACGTAGRPAAYGRDPAASARSRGRSHSALHAGRVRGPGHFPRARSHRLRDGSRHQRGHRRAEQGVRTAAHAGRAERRSQLRALAHAA